MVLTYLLWLCLIKVVNHSAEGVQDGKPSNSFSKASFVSSNDAREAVRETDRSPALPASSVGILDIAYQRSFGIFFTQIV